MRRAYPDHGRPKPKRPEPDPLIGWHRLGDTARKLQKANVKRRGRERGR